MEPTGAESAHQENLRLAADMDRHACGREEGFYDKSFFSNSYQPTLDLVGTSEGDILAHLSPCESAALLVCCHPQGPKRDNALQEQALGMHRVFGVPFQHAKNGIEDAMCIRYLQERTVSNIISFPGPPDIIEPAPQDLHQAA
jgi:hypothetical protein